MKQQIKTIDIMNYDLEASKAKTILDNLAYKAKSLEYENTQLKALLLRMIKAHGNKFSTEEIEDPNTINFFIDSDKNEVKIYKKN